MGQIPPEINHTMHRITFRDSSEKVVGTIVISGRYSNREAPPILAAREIAGPPNRRVITTLNTLSIELHGADHRQAPTAELVQIASELRAHGGVLTEAGETSPIIVACTDETFESAFAEQIRNRFGISAVFFDG